MPLPYMDERAEKPLQVRQAIFWFDTTASFAPGELQRLADARHQQGIRVPKNERRYGWITPVTEDE